MSGNVHFGDLLGYPLRSGVTISSSNRGSGMKMLNMGELFRHPRVPAVEMARVEIPNYDSDRTLLQRHDLLFARRSLTLEGAGKCSIVDEVDEPTTWEGSILRARLDPAIAHAPYYFYYFASPQGRRNIETIVEQVAAAGIRGSDLKKLEVPHPDLPEQYAVAEVLGALDDKIAANTKLARTAEDLLQASYRGLIDVASSRSVQVESLIHRITPKRKFIKDELLTKGDFPVFDQSDAGFLGYLKGDGFLNASVEEPILYFGDHTCKLRIAAQKFTVGPNTVPFKGSEIPSLTLYCALNGLQNHEEYKRHWQLLMKKEVTVPDAQTATAFALRHSHLLSVLQSVSRENTSLTATRDALLPRLMSGNLRVRDAEKALEEAGV